MNVKITQYLAADGSKFYNICHFHISHNTPCLPPKILHNLFPISPGCYSHPKRNWRQCLCKILGGKQGVVWGMWKRQIDHWPKNDTQHGSINMCTSLWYTTYNNMQMLSSGIPWNILIALCIFSVHTWAWRQVYIPGKYNWQWQRGNSMLYLVGEAHINYFLPGHRKVVNTINVTYTQHMMGILGVMPSSINSFLYISDWVYLLWHG